jgi:hypothetical protein
MIIVTSLYHLSRYRCNEEPWTWVVAVLMLVLSCLLLAPACSPLYGVYGSHDATHAHPPQRTPRFSSFNAPVPSTAHSRHRVHSAEAALATLLPASATSTRRTASAPATDTAWSSRGNRSFGVALGAPPDGTLCTVPPPVAPLPVPPEGVGGT